MADRKVVVAFGDMHCGSTVGLCPPTGLELDDGGWYKPSNAQIWIWEKWVDAWKQVKKLTGKSDLHLIVNGDAIDGDHHRTAQIASVLTGIHLRCAVECLATPLALKPRSVHVMRGTPSHVGRCGEVEEGIARVLKAEGWPVVEDPNGITATSYWRRLEIGGVKFDVKHHGRMGQRAHTRGSYSKLYAFDIWSEHKLRGEEAPDIAIRSHLHKFMDSGRDHRGVTRAVALPAWQLATEYVHRISVESLADLGLVAFVIQGGEYEMVPILYEPDTPQTWSAA